MGGIRCKRTHSIKTAELPITESATGNLWKSYLSGVFFFFPTENLTHLVRKLLIWFNSIKNTKLKAGTKKNMLTMQISPQPRAGYCCAVNASRLRGIRLQILLLSLPFISTNHCKRFVQYCFSLCVFAHYIDSWCTKLQRKIKPQRNTNFMHAFSVRKHSHEDTNTEGGGKNQVRSGCSIKHSSGPDSDQGVESDGVERGRVTVTDALWLALSGNPYCWSTANNRQSTERHRVEGVLSQPFESL